MKIVLFGACGKMGRLTAACGREEIVCGVDLKPAEMPFPVYDRLEEIGEADAAIDFSSPEGLQRRLFWCAERKLPLVLAVTGLSETDEAAINKAAKEIPIFRASNFSRGISVMQELLKQAAAALGDFDVEIIERHHSEKKDAPSGTALLLAGSVREGAQKNYPLRLGRGNERRNRGEIGIHAVRGGSIPGVHEVMFAGKGEILSITHTVLDPAVFARGALEAAHRICSLPPGLYGTEDLFRS